MRSSLIFVALVAGCSQRALQHDPDSTIVDLTSDQASVVDQTHPSDQHTVRDMVADAPPDASSAFCASAESRAVADGRELPVIVETGTTMTMESVGEEIRFVPNSSTNEVFEIFFTILHYQNVPVLPVQHFDLAQPPQGWIFIGGCTPYQLCHGLGGSKISGFLSIERLVGGPPGYKASLCAEYEPTAPGDVRFQLVAKNIWINTACIYNMESSCNADPEISSLRGHCNLDGTCTCNPDATPTSDGKCL